MSYGKQELIDPRDYYVVVDTPEGSSSIKDYLVRIAVTVSNSGSYRIFVEDEEIFRLHLIENVLFYSPLMRYCEASSSLNSQTDLLEISEFATIIQEELWK